MFCSQGPPRTERGGLRHVREVPRRERARGVPRVRHGEFLFILVWAICVMLSFYSGILWREFGGFGWDVQPTGGRPKRRDQSVTYTRGGQCKGVTSREEDAARGRQGGHRRQGEQQDAGSGRGQG